ncbi:MAG: hypothetical protein AAFW82_09075 [Pseudomonadota bacterium]
MQRYIETVEKQLCYRTSLDETKPSTLLNCNLRLGFFVEDIEIEELTIIDHVYPWVTALIFSVAWIGLAFCVAYPNLASTLDWYATAKAFVLGSDQEIIFIGILLLGDILIAVGLGHLARTKAMLTLSIASIFAYTFVFAIFRNMEPVTPQQLTEGAEKCCENGKYIPVEGVSIGGQEISGYLVNAEVSTLFGVALFLLFIPRFCSFLVPKSGGVKTKIK